MDGWTGHLSANVVRLASGRRLWSCLWKLSNWVSWMDTDELLKMSDAIISGHGTPRKTKRTMETIENGVDFPMSCLFSRMVMITDNDADDHATIFIVMEKVLEFGVCIFVLHRSLSLATTKNSSTLPTVTLRGLSDILIYNQILSCVPTSHLAVSLLQQLRNEKLRPTEITFGACLNACVKNGQWTMALAIQDILCDEIDWWMSCILKRTTVRVFFLYIWVFTHQKLHLPMISSGEHPKTIFGQGFKMDATEILEGQDSHLQISNVCEHMLRIQNMSLYLNIYIYLKFLTYHIESSKYCLFKKSPSKTKVLSFLVASYFFWPKRKYRKQESSAASCQEQASSDACANLITGSLTVRSFADALQWKDPRFRTSGGWFIRVKNSGFTELRYDS